MISERARQNISNEVNRANEQDQYKEGRLAIQENKHPVKRLGLVEN